MAREVGFEPTTCGLEDRCSIQLSYSRIVIRSAGRPVFLPHQFQGAMVWMSLWLSRIEIEGG